ncbi:hypothetical protein FRC00_002889 [Tulasnella sp. 408]|nr:hypothetical protein FRC00_002889 [Tulasnella sp. 408]
MADLFFHQTLVQILGAAFAASLTNVDVWSSGYEEYSVGGLLHGILSPAKGFGSFLTVLLSLSVSANVAPTLYSFSLNFQVIFPPLHYLPRPVFSLIASAILVPLSIVGKTRFYLNLVNFLGIIGYWVGCFGATVLMEHLVIRKGKWERYDAAVWDKPRQLPIGLAALLASAGSFGLIWAALRLMSFTRG